MAVYKVIQDIEAEDKLLGPLTLKSFIYAAIAGVLAFLNVRLLIAGGPLAIKLVIIAVLFFPMLLFAVLASPLGRDQPTEVWLLSRVRFLLKEHKRVWDQSGINQLVTITVPKQLERQLTKGFSQSEVQSRLQALASTLDSRGWVVKNSAVNLSGQAGYLDEAGSDSDRLITPSSVAAPSQVIDIRAADDILDEQNNATAQKFNQLVKESDVKRKQTIKDKLDRVRQNAASSPAQDSRFLDSAQTGAENTTFVGRAVVAPHTDASISTPVVNDAQITADAQAVLEAEHKRAEEIHRRSATFKPKNEPAAKTTPPTVTAAQTAAKLELAQSGNDLSVASIAHLANRNGQIEQLGPNEVLISLH